MRIRIGKAGRALAMVLLTTCWLGSSPALAGMAGSGGGEADGGGDLVAVALQHLHDQRSALGLGGGDLSDLVVKDRYTSRHNGITHIYLRQRLGGIEVYRADAGVHLDREGRVVHSTSRLIAGLDAAATGRAVALTPAQGVEAAAAAVDLSLTEPLVELESLGGIREETLFSGGGVSVDDIPVKLIYQPLDSGIVELAWDVTLRPAGGEHWWSVRVSAADGRPLSKDDWVAWDSYRVFAFPKENPDDGPRTLEVDPADATASPFGWHDTNGAAGAEFNDTRGNNAFAQTDLDANNVFTAGVDVRPNGGASRVFDFPLDLALQPSTYREAAVTNLFYWNNICHDIHYHYGFDEPAGNFQQNNYGLGGSGNDAVQADAQDGSGTNNANFSTPPDGFAGRMQMFIWTPPNLLRVNSPPAIAGDYTMTSAAFGPQLTTTGVTGDIVLADDGTGTATDGCEPLINGGAISGNLALIDRGGCSFVTKARNAQNAGATVAVIVNNVPGSPVALGDDGTGGDIVIPSGMISLADGDLIKAQLPGVNATALLASTLNRDSDLDSGVIVHEYGHGVSNRLTGGPGTVGCLPNPAPPSLGSQSGSMGEGWSDFWALAFTAVSGDQAEDPRGIGAYVSFQPPGGPGIRPAPYSTDLAINPRTFGELANVGQPGALSTPHGVGTVWASMLWEMYWGLIEAHGYDGDLYGGGGGNGLALQLVMDGLKLQPCLPRFVDARDAILTADQNLTGGANQCLIWNAFAKRGLGFSASGGANHLDFNVTEAFDVPAACCGNDAIEGTEICDGIDLGGETCVSLGFSGGILGCSATCDAFDTSNCVNCDQGPTRGSWQPPAGGASGLMEGYLYLDNGNFAYKVAARLVETSFGKGTIGGTLYDGIAPDPDFDVRGEWNAFTLPTPTWSAGIYLPGTNTAVGKMGGTFNPSTTSYSGRWKICQ